MNRRQFLASTAAASPFPADTEPRILRGNARQLFRL